MEKAIFSPGSVLEVMLFGQRAFLCDHNTMGKHINKQGPHGKTTQLGAKRTV